MSPEQVTQPTLALAFMVPSSSEYSLSLRSITGSATLSPDQRGQKSKIRKGMGYAIALKRKEVLFCWYCFIASGPHSNRSKGYMPPTYKPNGMNQ
jgi:hypothetical protein